MCCLCVLTGHCCCSVDQPVDRYQLENLATGISMLCERLPHIQFTTPLEMYALAYVHTQNITIFLIVGCVKLK